MVVLPTTQVLNNNKVPMGISDNLSEPVICQKQSPGAGRMPEPALSIARLFRDSVTFR